MSFYEKNNAVQLSGVSVVDKVHAQVCRAISIPVNNAEAKEIFLFLQSEFKKGVIDHKRLIDLALAKINTADRAKRKEERISEEWQFGIPKRKAPE